MPVLLAGAAWQGAPRYHPAALDRAAFTELVTSDIASQTGSTTLYRSTDRWARYDMTTAGDTIVVHADSVRLAQTIDAGEATVDVDAVIGARWRFILGAAGPGLVVTRPYVPQAIADVSDMTRAMDDFLPPAPPTIAPGAHSTDASHREWQRLGDSAGLGRYRMTSQRTDTLNATHDSIAVHTIEHQRETTHIAWDRARGPVHWTRHITTDATSHFTGRTVRARVEQHIAVDRISR